MAKEENPANKETRNENLIKDEDIDTMFDNVVETNNNKDASSESSSGGGSGEKVKTMTKNAGNTPGPTQKVSINVDKNLFDEFNMIFKLSGETKNPEVIFGTWVNAKMAEVKDKVSAQIKKTALV